LDHNPRRGLACSLSSIGESGKAVSGRFGVDRSSIPRPLYAPSAAVKPAFARAAGVPCDGNHIAELEPALSFAHPIAIDILLFSRMTTMIGFLKTYGHQMLAASALLSLTSGLALAGEATLSADQIVQALKPKPMTRGLTIGPQGSPQIDPAAEAKETALLKRVRNRKTRSLSLGERQQIAEIAATKPNVDLEIQFDYNSAEISQASMPAVQELGKALSDPSLKDATFVVAGHTDGVGSEGFNQGLSERRADTIKRYLVEKFGLAGKDLVAVGYGKTKLKDTANPADPVNRRVQVVNMEARAAAK
jgi:outer membrane protein OmpA-like peptidoglycan-associated protein